MMMCDQMMVMMEFRRVVVLVIPRAQLEYMAQCREHEEK